MKDADIYQCYDCNKQFYPEGPFLSKDGMALSGKACIHCESENTWPLFSDDED